MKLSAREKRLVALLQKFEGRTIDLDTIISSMPVPKKQKNIRRNFVSLLLVFRKKLDRQGISLDRVSPIGAGHKAIYFVPIEIRRIAGE